MFLTPAEDPNPCRGLWSGFVGGSYKTCSLMEGAEFLQVQSRTFNFLKTSIFRKNHTSPLYTSFQSKQLRSEWNFLRNHYLELLDVSTFHRTWNYQGPKISIIKYNLSSGNILKRIRNKFKGMFTFGGTGRSAYRIVTQTLKYSNHFLQNR